MVGFFVNGAPQGPAARPARDVTRADVDMFRREFTGGNVLVPGDPAYGQVKFFNGRFDHIKPAAIIQPTSEAGVLQAIQWAQRNGVRFAIKGGGHHYEGHSKIPGAVIDLSKLKMDLANQRLEVDPVTKASLITVGAGNVLGELYDALATPDGRKNRVVPAGTSKGVGVIGHAMGGGLADLTPQLGYTAQNLEQVRLVTYSGKILDINDRGISEIRDGKPMPYTGNVTGAEVMIALRGGGQALAGIVTQAKLKTHDMNQYDMRYFSHQPANNLSKEGMIKLATAWQNWQTANPEMAKSVSSKLNMGRSGNEYFFDISGVIATKDPAQVEAIRRSMSEFTSLMGAVKTEFSSKPQNMWQIFQKYKDTDELTENKKRNSHIVRSTIIPDKIPDKNPQNAMRYLIENMTSGGRNPVTIYAAGGATLDGIHKTSLPPAKLLVEMETIGGNQQTLDNYHRGFMQAAGAQYVYANYPGNGKTATDPDLIKKIRDEFSPPAPQRIAHSPLADGIVVHARQTTHTVTTQRTFAVSTHIPQPAATQKPDAPAGQITDPAAGEPSKWKFKF